MIKIWLRKESLKSKERKKYCSLEGDNNEIEIDAEDIGNTKSDGNKKRSWFIRPLGKKFLKNMIHSPNGSSNILETVAKNSKD